MSYVLGEQVTLGAYSIAIVSLHVVRGKAVGPRGIALYCSKVPTYVVVQNDQDIWVFDMAGESVTLAQARSLCPTLETITKPDRDKLQ